MISGNFWNEQYPKLEQDCIRFLKKLKSQKRVISNELPKELLVYANNGLEIFYTPFELMEQDLGGSKIKLFLVGISPGKQQALDAIAAYINDFGGKSIEDGLIEEASFSDAVMRSNIYAMLDELGVNKALKISSTRELFTEKKSHLLGVTSVLSLPVLKNGKNFTGSSPNISKTEVLRSMIDSLFVEELKELNQNALIVPLGLRVQEQLERLSKLKMVRSNSVLWGFPHPSGQNGWRLKFFNKNKSKMKKIVKDFFN